SGAYDNAVDGSLVATLIHEEIAARHRAMPVEVDFLATFSVVYRRELLESLGGFDERYLRGQDAELSFRAHRAGSRLHFELASRVAHHHEKSLRRYLRAQYHQGYWRAFLHTEHAGHAGGDSYSRLSDHLQPPVALLTLCAPLAFLFVPPTAAAALVGSLLTLLLALPLGMARRVAAAAGPRVAAAYVPFSAVRACWRGAGFAAGAVDKLTRPDAGAPPATAAERRRRAQLGRWLTWLVFAHLTWGLVRLPGKVINRRAEEAVLYQKAGPEQWFFRGDAMRGADVITWLREHTPPSCVIAWEGERLGAMEFAVGLLSPRYFVRAEDAARVAAATGAPIATAELDGRRGHVTVTATRNALEVSVR
ncbi:MAG: glycosyltransferase family 2 protein, partial [Planctomycetota bacterium]